MNPGRTTNRARLTPAQDGSARQLALLLVALALAAGLSVFLARQSAQHRGTSGTGSTTAPVQLSDSTRAILRRLKSPLEIRFYDSLDPTSVAEPVRAFAGRIEPLLEAYARESDGRVTVRLFNTPSNFDANAASAEGIKPFNLDKGEACFLGVALELGGHKTALPRLAPEWEAALEPDLSRAISGLIDLQAPAPGVTVNAPVDPAAVEAVKQLFPDLSTVSLEQGKTTLREEALKDFKSAMTEMNRGVQEAQQRFIEAQKNGSEAEQASARDQLQQAQAAQVAKMDELAARARAQVQAFEKLKAGQ